tara:strand:- start:3014 stop:3592 length:579 start_codon:yes stop_codon:yes gene_type:complete
LEKKSPEYMIVGLGNPGETYNNTRHNVGWACVEKLMQKYSTKKSSHKFAYLNKGIILNKNILFVLPLTFINRSGIAVNLFKNTFSIPSQNIIVVSDDIRLRLGRIKIRALGGDGGHNGIKSIISYINTNNFPRIRIGIGEPNDQKDHADYVLSKIPKKESIILGKSINNTIRAIEIFLEYGIEKSMNECNRK